jgi:hypothetical protein
MRSTGIFEDHVVIRISHQAAPKREAADGSIHGRVRDTENEIKWIDFETRSLRISISMRDIY